MTVVPVVPLVPLVSVGLRPIMYYTASLLLTIQRQLLCQAIVGLVYKWEGLFKIVWGGCKSNKSWILPDYDNLKNAG